MRDRHRLSVAVFVLVTQNNTILLVRRSQTGWKEGEYSLPAGGLETGETLTQAAIRELNEETTLRVAEEDLELVHCLHVGRGDTSEPWLGFFFLARRWAGTPTLAEPHKHSEMGWFDREELPLATVDYVRQALGQSRQGVRWSSFGW